MMNLPALYGLLSTALIVSAILSSLLPKKRLAVFIFLLILLFIPLYGICTAQRLFALTDTLSLTLLTLTLSFWAHRPAQIRIGELIVLMAVEMALLLTETGLIPYDLYGWGYRGETATAAVCIGILLLPKSRWLFCLAVYILYRTGIYQNLFDAVTDPATGVVVTILLAAAGFKRFKGKKNALLQQDI